MSDKGFWGRIFGGQADDQVPTHSFEELHRIHNVLLDPQNQVVNSFNKALLIETLRELAELLIWGDQNDPRVFEYFLEHNLLRHYKRILAVPSHRRGGVAVQLLQVRMSHKHLVQLLLSAVTQPQDTSVHTSALCSVLDTRMFACLVRNCSWFWSLAYGCTG